MIQLDVSRSSIEAQAHQSRRDLLPALHVGKQIRSACKRHGVRSLAIQNARRFLDRAWRAEFEKWQPHHELSTFSFSVERLLVRGTSFTAFPSPPSHGGGTRSASGHSTCGKFPGP